MGVSKVTYYGETLIDLTGDTVTPGTLAVGETAHDAKGNEITGSFTLQDELNEQDNLIDQIKKALAMKVTGGSGGK